MFLRSVRDCVDTSLSAPVTVERERGNTLPLVSTDKGPGLVPRRSAEGMLGMLPVLPPGPFNELRRKGFVDIRFQKPCTPHARFSRSVLKRLCYQNTLQQRMTGSCSCPWVSMFGTISCPVAHQSGQRLVAHPSAQKHRHCEAPTACRLSSNLPQSTSARHNPTNSTTPCSWYSSSTRSTLPRKIISAIYIL